MDLPSDRSYKPSLTRRLDSGVEAVERGVFANVIGAQCLPTPFPERECDSHSDLRDKHLLALNTCLFAI